ncbi:MARVEL domain-containing protein 3 [Chanos chanos]|uniref:MARVEL domain-containing protein 3 n=1 Tax=Chanos chanos TaxID=29144 RepID=A0A6J2UL44_CHACN|nr:MARVEL domain-containing protein 3-like [Chanos chanos]
MGKEKNYARKDQDRLREFKRERGDDRYREKRDPVHGHVDQIRGYADKQRSTSTHWHPRESEDTFPHRHERMYTDTTLSNDDDSYPHQKEALYNLRYLATARGLCQAIEFFFNLLIVICAGVSHSTSGGYRDLASLGGLYHYYFGGASAFTGAEAERVKELDTLFYQLKLPPYIFSMACGGALMIYACAMLALGVFRVPFRRPLLLLVEALLDGLIGLAYIPAVAFYFIKLQETYNHPICKEREEMYKSKGHKGFECNLHGADVAGGLFGVLCIIIFPISAVLAIRAFRAVRKQKQQRALENSNF